MGLLKVQFSTAINAQSYFLINMDDIVLIRPGDNAGANLTTTTSIIVDTGVAASDVITFTHGTAATGYSVVDAFMDAWAAKPSGGVSLVGGIPATVSGTGQALTFVQFTAWADN